MQTQRPIETTVNIERVLLLNKYRQIKIQLRQSKEDLTTEKDRNQGLIVNLQRTATERDQFQQDLQAEQQNYINQRNNWQQARQNLLQQIQNLQQQVTMAAVVRERAFQLDSQFRAEEKEYNRVEMNHVKFPPWIEGGNVKQWTAKIDQLIRENKLPKGNEPDIEINVVR